LEATWALVGVTGGTFDKTREIADQGAFPVLVKLFKSCHAELVEHVILFKISPEEILYVGCMGNWEYIK